MGVGGLRHQAASKRENRAVKVPCGRIRDLCLFWAISTVRTFQRHFCLVRVNVLEIFWERVLFFFKQKTAYEIGLGIPAEPLFRSTLFPYTQDAFSRSGWLWPVDAKGEPLKRSEERRVGKECRSRWWPYY